MIKNFLILSIVLAAGLFSGWALAQENDDGRWVSESFHYLCVV
ncbi:MAG: hypothetical protein Q8L26_03150 [Candidatus Omnitrophota bacterium]|nr:hypothetical protein [Candidatus Omnitrophota bacterium]